MFDRRKEEPLHKKLGIGERDTVHLLDVPLCVLEQLPSEITSQQTDLERASTILIGVTASLDIQVAVKAIGRGYMRGKKLWFLYPKRSGSIRTDINRDRGWDPIRELGLQPVAQVSAGLDWSCIRFRLATEIKTSAHRKE